MKSYDHKNISAKDNIPLEDGLILWKILHTRIIGSHAFIPNEHYVFHDVLSDPHYTRTTKNRLLELYDSTERDQSKCIKLLGEILPEVKCFLSLNSEMEATDDVSQKIKLLNQYLNDGFLLKPVDAPALIKQYEAYPDLIRFFIQHEACTSLHLIHIFKNRHVYMEYATLCLNQEKFTAYPMEYITHAGESFSDSCLAHLKNASANHAAREPDAVIDFIQLFLTIRPTLITSIDLTSLYLNIINWYTSKAIHSNLNHQSFTIDDADTDAKKSMFVLQEALILIINHKEFQFLPEERQYRYASTDTTAQRNTFYSSNYGLYFGAKNGCKKIFDTYYIHEDTPSDAKKFALMHLKEHGHSALLDDITYPLFQAGYYDIRLVTFIFAMNELAINKDIQHYTLTFCLKIISLECSSTLLNTFRLPPTYKMKTPLTLFKQAVISYEWLITRGKVAIYNYLDNANEDNAPSEKGKHRATSFIEIFICDTYSTGCKMMAFSALMHEKTREANRLKENYLKRVMGCYSDKINKAAIQFANENHLNLEVFSDTLIAYIHDKVKFNPDEKTFLRQCNAYDKNETCLVM
jgi:hypothetical protein